MKVDRHAKSLDDLVTDLLVATLFDTERPPRGVSGLVDWRLNGFLSRLIMSGSVTGRKDEIVLLPLHRRLPARRLLLVGLGSRHDYTLMQARHTAYKVAKAIKGIAAIDVAISFPPVVDERSPTDTEQAVLDVFRQAHLPEGLWVRWLLPPMQENIPVVPEILSASKEPLRV